VSEITDLLERFRRGAELVAVVTTGAAGQELDFSPAADRWTVRQIVGHLADSEIVTADRMRRVIAEENPTLLAMDEKAWAEKLDYGRRRFSQMVETFRRIRGENYELLNGLPEEAFQRPGTHSERGQITLLDLLRIYTEHAENHSRQIRTVRDAYKQVRAAGTH
jgi:hypothetical protein